MSVLIQLSYAQDRSYEPYEAQPKRSCHSTNVKIVVRRTTTIKKRKNVERLQMQVAFAGQALNGKVVSWKEFLAIKVLAESHVQYRYSLHGIDAPTAFYFNYQVMQRHNLPIPGMSEGEGEPKESQRRPLLQRGGVSQVRYFTKCSVNIFAGKSQNIVTFVPFLHFLLKRPKTRKINSKLQFCFTDSHLYGHSVIEKFPKGRGTHTRSLDCLPNHCTTSLSPPPEQRTSICQ